MSEAVEYGAERHRFTSSLIDDILIFSMVFDQHLKHLQEVLERLRQARLTVNTKKCKFAANDIFILGFQAEFILTKPRFWAVANWPVPKNKTQLKSFLSLTGFFRQFVPQNAKVAYPLSELLGKKKPDKLTELQICLSPCLSCLTPRKLWRQQY